MFLSTILLALIVGAIAGGGIPRLADLHLRWTFLLIAALLLRLLAGLSRETGIAADIPVGWAFIAAYGLIFAWLWGNWRVPGLQIASVGIGANMAAVLVNAGQMPIWAAAFFAAGFSEEVIANDPFHFLLQTDTVAEFVARGGLFGDVIPAADPDHPRRDQHRRRAAGARDLLGHRVLDDARRGSQPCGTRVRHQPDDSPRRRRNRDDRDALRRRRAHSGRDDRGAGRRRRAAPPVAVPAPGPQPELQPAVDRAARSRSSATASTSSRSARWSPAAAPPWRSASSSP